MDRKHRDRVAFCRICSGTFERGMKVKHMRLGRDLRLAYANSFMAQDRETIEQAFAGDILGIIDTGNFRIGDTITDGRSVVYQNMPRFSPEVFGRLNIKDPLKRRQMQKGIQELAEEGSVQTFYDPLIGKQDPILGVVGELQFDVLLNRLNDEYKLEVKLERMNFSVARWPRKKDGTAVGTAINGGSKLYRDATDQAVVLLQREWDVNWLVKENPDLDFHITGN
jgi:peptide chain release factor 3